MQSSGLIPFDCFVALGCSSQSCFLPFHRPFEPKIRAAKKNSSSFLFSAFPVFTRSLNTFVRANNPTYSFIPLLCIQQYYCLSPFMFSAVAPKTSSWGCSTTFCTKLRNATLLLLFSQRNALSISHHSVNYVLFSSLGCWSFAATPHLVPRKIP